MPPAFYISLIKFEIHRLPLHYHHQHYQFILCAEENWNLLDYEAQKTKGLDIPNVIVGSLMLLCSILRGLRNCSWTDVINIGCSMGNTGKSKLRYKFVIIHTKLTNNTVFKREYIVNNSQRTPIIRKYVDAGSAAFY